MDSSFLSITTKAVAIFVLWYVYKLPYYYRAGRRTGLPVFLSPITPSHPVWLVLLPTLQPFLERRLPTIIYQRLSLCIFGWPYRERWNVQARLGESFVLVAPGGIEIWTADPEASNEILARRRDFVQIEIARKIMSVFGNNVTSSDEQDWQRNRKIVAPALNERIMAAVWNESRCQAHQMMDFFTEKGSLSSAVTDRVVEGLNVLAINVMTAVAYGEQASWALDGDHSEGSPEGHSLSFIEVMALIVKFQVPITLVSSSILSWRFMPQIVRKLGTAKSEYPAYASKMISNHREGKTDHHTLIGTLVRVADESSRASNSRIYLTESEIIGNIFNITIAGFDTTANSIAYAFLALALWPEWQEWVVEEFNNFAHEPGALEYQTHFPLLVRCMALLFETVRLYTPVVHIARTTNGTQNSPFPAPEGTNVFIAAACLHVSPAIWGDDALEFRPTRFIQAAKDLGTKESLVEPAKGTFIPWGSGPRHCPGQKMAHVEFVATVREVLENWKIEPAERDGESKEMARMRLEELVKDSQPRVSQQLRHPEEVLLKFSKRSKTIVRGV